MVNKKLYIISSEFDFLAVPIAIQSFEMIRQGWSNCMKAELEQPITIWFENRLFIYKTILIKPRYFLESLKNIYKKKSMVVNIEAVSENGSSETQPIGFADLYAA